MTNDLISRDDFINSIVCSVSSPCETKQERRDAQFKQKYTVDAFIKELKRVPAVDAVEVVHAGWQSHGDFFTSYLKCPVCEKSICAYADNGDGQRFDYCPNCGAKMDKRRESEGT